MYKRQAHDTEDKLTDMQCLPDSLQGRKYYQPTEQGSEARVKERLRQIEACRQQRQRGAAADSRKD